ncbi:hypothetical protein K435DRAFT_810448 [Dendrothele bispora CBS 962.96]|uniref:Uncharacterized protein n=1 Tax=Dendrothele bispora (strain CBS 962.96) TaxID=1314807 RepID=A0A4V4HBL0_DENBC|nr:hypothetical protein K435DRAFT_810448 [Dendrothele bispora CBS 962.96]
MRCISYDQHTPTWTDLKLSSDATGPLSDLDVSVTVEWVVDIAVGYLFYGINSVISFTVIYLLTTTSTRMTRAQLGLLFLTIFMLLVSTLFMSLETAFILVQIPRMGINPPARDIVLLINHIKMAYTYAASLNLVACDGITVWRAWILYPPNLGAKIVLILCMIGSIAGTFVNAGFVAAHEKSKEASNSGISLTQSIKFASQNTTEPEIQE